MMVVSCVDNEKIQNITQNTHYCTHPHMAFQSLFYAMVVCVTFV